MPLAACTDMTVPKQRSRKQYERVACFSSVSGMPESAFVGTPADVEAQQPSSDAHMHIHVPPVFTHRQLR